MSNPLMLEEIASQRALAMTWMFLCDVLEGRLQSADIKRKWGG